MKEMLIVLAGFAGVVALAVIVITRLTPRLDRWGATAAEAAASYPGDELVPAPASFVNRAITIQARPEQIYPWLVQLGADKGGLYSYTALERLVGCPMVNADRIHPEWQGLKVSDTVKMNRTKPVPPPYIVAQIIPNQALVMGHRENDQWVDLWQFVLVPQTASTTRLVLRTRTMMTGGFWDIIHPGVFIMERGMLRGIKERAEGSAQAG